MTTSWVRPVSPLALYLVPTRLDLAEMSVNAEPFRVLHTTNCESVLKQDFATIMEHVDTIKVQGEYNCIRLETTAHP
jgi:hypothetical protein